MSDIWSNYEDVCAERDRLKADNIELQKEIYKQMADRDFWKEKADKYKDSPRSSQG